MRGLPLQVEKWDRRFLKLAFHIAQWSKDPSTKCGTVIVRPDRTIVSTGFNGFAKTMRDDTELYEDREVKYDRIIHSEMNALIHAREQVAGCTLFTTPMLICSRCVVHMIQAGIVEFVGPTLQAEQVERWADAVAKTRGYIEEAGCQYREIDIENWHYQVPDPVTEKAVSKPV